MLTVKGKIIGSQVIADDGRVFNVPYIGSPEYTGYFLLDKLPDVDGYKIVRQVLNFK
jgi:hypothetical protein